MEKIIYTHLNDPEWIKKREENWDSLFWRTMQDQPKYYWGHIKKYYFDGDVDAFIRGKNSYFKKKKLPVDLHGPSIVQILEYSPAKDLEQIVFAINKAFHWYDVNRSIISERRIEAVKKSFLNQLCFFLLFMEKVLIQDWLMKLLLGFTVSYMILKGFFL